MDILKKIEEIGIVPVVVIEDAKDAVPLAKALIEGGIPVAEVTFRTAAAEDTIRAIKEAYPEMLVGAGTVLTDEQADRALSAGASFIVSPGLNPAHVSYVLSKGALMIPGVFTPSEIETGLSLGLEVLKFFPAEPSGGLPMIKALTSAFVNLKLLPTGGINLENAEAYLKDPHILAVGGSWMVKKDLIREGRFDEIRRMTEEAASLVKRVRG